ncbi:unannotated protein [freshwater metagenome]|uniref:Unannotated protein n=1 Tax=freshwater metagenome TaxID=449393 RepID=A0A6J5YPD5_9ZZZZ
MLLKGHVPAVGVVRSQLARVKRKLTRPTQSTNVSPGTSEPQLEDRVFSSRDDFCARVNAYAAEHSALEIGPLGSPTITVPHAEFFDILPTNELRIKAAQSGHDPEKVPNIDWVSPTGDLNIVTRRYQLIYSSHVIEHQPDLVRHLQNTAQLLTDDGIYVMAIPDKRYCFDHFFDESTFDDVVKAHDERRKVPTQDAYVRSVAQATHNEPGRHWAGDHGRDHDRVDEMVVSASKAYKQANGAYLDVHTWYFTPESFVSILAQLHEAGLSPWRVRKMQPTLANTFEFYVVLDIPVDSRGTSNAGSQAETFWNAQRNGWTTTLELRHHQVAVNHIGFVTAAPAANNALGIFGDVWTSSVPGFSNTGSMGLFADPRIGWLQEVCPEMSGLRVLELGPLEAGHTYALESMGAEVTAIESSISSFLRCLAVKNALHMKSTFVLGDFTKSFGDWRYGDLIVASGVLYHLIDPIDMLVKIGNSCDRVFIWTHYFDPNLDHWAEPIRAMARTKWHVSASAKVHYAGEEYTLVPQLYGEELAWGGFCGGTATQSNWMLREDILKLLRQLGFTHQEIAFDEPQHPNGPSFAIYAAKAEPDTKLKSN